MGKCLIIDKLLTIMGIAENELAEHATKSTALRPPVCARIEDWQGLWSCVVEKKSD